MPTAPMKEYTSLDCHKHYGLGEREESLIGHWSFQRALYPSPSPAHNILAMNIAGHDIGVCSWSLRPTDIGDLVAKVRQLDLQHVQLTLEPLLFLDDKRRHQQLGLLRNAELTITSTMISYPGEDYSSIASIRDTGGLVPDA